MKIEKVLPYNSSDLAQCSVPTLKKFLSEFATWFSPFLKIAIATPILKTN
jgi:hypothetical protein